MENVVAAELRHQRAYQEGHADIRVLAQVWQNILQKKRQKSKTSSIYCYGHNHNIL